MPKKRSLLLSAFVASIIVGTLLYSKVSFNNREDREGIYILSGGEHNEWLTVTDDLYASESNRLLWGIAHPAIKRATSSESCKPTDKPCTAFEWNDTTGRGFIKTYYPDGRKLIIGLGRFISSNGRPVSGLFIGGGVPVSDPDYQASNNNETGMTYFDGNRFFHIWCNVNEGIEDAAGNTILPSTWEYVSSKIIENSNEDLTIRSYHKVLVNNVPLNIERTMFYKTGDTFLTFVTKLTNIGNTPTTFMYVYGDEPWLGNYYTFSKGNIGWYADGLITTETLVNTSKYNYVGMFDYGNTLAGETHSFTGKANFLEWKPTESPDTAYVSNNFGIVAPPEKKVPLSSYKNRVVSLQWGPRILPPKNSFSFKLRVGMADIDPKTGFPVKPDTSHK